MRQAALMAEGEDAAAARRDAEDKRWTLLAAAFRRRQVTSEARGYMWCSGGR